MAVKRHVPTPPVYPITATMRGFAAAAVVAADMILAVVIVVAVLLH
jgi:hypothetical protein